MQDLITIGELSRQTSLSLKALRLYDARGLLRPARIDERTGFRYYGPGEVVHARRIAMLRGIGMPLDEIAGVLQAPDVQHAARAVAAYWRDCQHRHQARASLAAYVQEEFMTDSPAGYRVMHRQVSQQKVVSIRGYADATSLPAFVPHACEELFAFLQVQHLPLSGPVFVVFHSLVSEDAEGVVEVCAPTEGNVAPSGRIGVRLEPAHAQVYVAVRAADAVYPTILAAYDTVAGALQRHGLALAGPAREVSYPNARNAAADELTTDVAYPHTCGSACATLPVSAWPDPRWADR